MKNPWLAPPTISYRSGYLTPITVPRGSSLEPARWCVMAIPFFLLAGCATYQPSPLSSSEVAFAKPDLSALSLDASLLDRPFLSAQAIDLSQPLTPNALAVISVLENPDLKALRIKAGVSDAQAFAARLLPDPTAQLGFDKLLSGPDTLNGLAGQIGFDLSAMRTRNVTAESARATRRQVRLDLAWAEWQTSGAARLQGARIVALQRQLGLARASASSAEDLLQRSQRAAGRGDITASDTDARRLAALDSGDRLRTVDRDLTAARLELNRLLGLPPSFAVRLAPAPDHPVPPSTEILVAQAVARRLDLQALRAGYDASEADTRKAILDQFPNLSLTVASARDTAGNVTLGPQIGFTLPLWNRNRGGIAVARATRAQLHAEYDARLFQTRADIAAATASLATIRRQQAALRAAMPALERFASATARAEMRGDLSQATAQTAAQTLRDRQIALAALDQQAAETIISLELLSGGPSEVWNR
ncbi:TolC family protein [Sphingobium sp. JS3065]|uniref:TolC family protein n=1 Tax=Sphingobium sp. JS3065 TaxID=2970925 RepID=UPI00226437A4|nr:TolC family protein [Sphingobium sp. JS3065]MCI2053349.1 TolC family protein [Sphingobium sp.]UZW56745.1 TolC family protein [Sphingobium sp. JS3065]